MRKLIGTLALAAGLAAQSGCLELEAVTGGYPSYSSVTDEYYYDSLGTWISPSSDSYYYDTEYYTEEWIEEDGWYYDDYYEEWYYYDDYYDEWYYYDDYSDELYYDDWYYDDYIYYDEYEGVWYYYDEYYDEWYYEYDW